jgi:hypothetical protein
MSEINQSKRSQWCRAATWFGTTSLGSDTENELANQTTESFEEFDRNWKEQCNNPDSNKKNTLAKALYHTFKRKILIAAMFKFLWGVFVLLAVSYFVRELLAYIRFRYV